MTSQIEPLPAPAAAPVPLWLLVRKHVAWTRYAALCCIGGACALAAPLWPFSTSYLRLAVDLAGHFVWAYLPIALVIAIVAKIPRARGLAIVAALLSATALLLANEAALKRANPPVGSALRVMSANVYAGNESTEKLEKLLSARQPDVVFVQEVTPKWAAVLENLSAYPYRKVIPRRDSFGIAILSKHPLKNVAVLDESEFDQPAIAATMHWQGRDVDLVAVHPLPPIGARAYSDRNTVLSRHAVVLNASGRPSIMGGDFNATPWSAGVAVATKAGLTRATSLAPTWPANLAAPALIPIDHIMVSKHWGLTENARGSNIGSDHFPVEATIFLN